MSTTRQSMLLQTNKLCFFVVICTLCFSFSFVHCLRFPFSFLAASFSYWLLDFKASLKFYLVWSFFFLLVFLCFCSLIPLLPWLFWIEFSLLLFSVFCCYCCSLLLALAASLLPLCWPPFYCYNLAPFIDNFVLINYRCQYKLHIPNTLTL